MDIALVFVPELDKVLESIHVLYDEVTRLSRADDENPNTRRTNVAPANARNTTMAATVATNLKQAKALSS